MKIDDRRASKVAPWGYVVFTDSFMSGWGEARSGRSFYALAVAGPQEAEMVLANGKRRSEMKRGRITKNLPKLRRGDHLAVVDRETADRWYEPGAWSPDGRGGAAVSAGPYVKGTRIEIHPASEWWMRGEKFAVVTSCKRVHGRQHDSWWVVYCHGERSGKRIRLHEANVIGAVARLIHGGPVHNLDCPLSEEVGAPAKCSDCEDPFTETGPASESFAAPGVCVHCYTEGGES